MRTPLNIGIVGFGYWGPNLARNFNALTGACLSAVCDPSDSRRIHVKELYPHTGIYSDFNVMLNDACLDAVVVATPVKTHHLLAKASLQAGKHVLLEKPMAGSMKDCEELIALARQQNLILMVDHTYLYSAPIAKISEIIRGGDIGEIRYINCQRLNLGIFQQDTNVVWDLAPHDLAIILQVIGELPQIVNCQGNAHINPQIVDVANLSLTFSGNRFATIQSSWLEPKKVRQMTFVGTRKMIVYDDLQPLEKIRIYDVRVDCPQSYETFSEFHYAYHYGDCYIPRVEQYEPLSRMCAHFIECITEHRVPISCGTNGLEVVRILEASHQSLQSQGGPVGILELPIALMRSERTL